MGLMEDVIRESGTIENRYVKIWKEENRPVVGYICTATPVEILEAGGILPYRIRALGSTKTEIADSHLSRFNCAFCRACLQLGLDGTYHFLDGILETNGCDHLRGMMENWQYVKNYRFFHYIRVPHIINKELIRYFAGEIKDYKKAVEGYFGRQITEEGLWEAMKRQEKLRERFREIYKMRENDNPPFTGTEVLSLFLLSTAAPSDVMLEVLEGVMKERAEYKIKNYRARLLVGGGATDEVELIRVIEDLGGLVVSDALCYGGRALLTQFSEEGDPFYVMAEGYLKGLMCPRIVDGFSDRVKYIINALEKARVDGVVLFHNKFCDLHGIDNVQLKLELEKRDIPVLLIEKEYATKSDTGRIKTRIQAFLEMIEKK